MSKEFTDFIAEFTEDVTAEYRRLARGTPKNNRFLLGKIQREAVKIIAKQYFPYEPRKHVV